MKIDQYSIGSVCSCVESALNPFEELFVLTSSVLTILLINVSFNCDLSSYCDCSSELEEALLLLPFYYIQELLPLLAKFIEEEAEVELPWRCVMLLVRYNINVFLLNLFTLCNH